MDKFPSPCRICGAQSHDSVMVWGNNSIGLICADCVHKIGPNNELTLFEPDDWENRASVEWNLLRQRYEGKKGTKITFQRNYA